MIKTVTKLLTSDFVSNFCISSSPRIQLQKIKLQITTNGRNFNPPLYP